MAIRYVGVMRRIMVQNPTNLKRVLQLYREQAPEKVSEEDVKDTFEHLKPYWEEQGDSIRRNIEKHNNLERFLNTI